MKEGSLWKNRHPYWLIYPHLEDHPMTCKWLGSPLFISHLKAIWKGNNPRGLRSPWLFTTYVRPGSRSSKQCPVSCFFFQKKYLPSSTLGPSRPSFYISTGFTYGCLRVFPPNHPLKNRVFHYFHHPIWGTPIFGNTHYNRKLRPCFLSWLNWDDFSTAMTRQLRSLEKISFCRGPLVFLGLRKKNLWMSESKWMHVIYYILYMIS